MTYVYKPPAGWIGPLRRAASWKYMNRRRASAPWQVVQTLSCVKTRMCHTRARSSRALTVCTSGGRGTGVARPCVRWHVRHPIVPFGSTSPRSLNSGRKPGASGAAAPGPILMDHRDIVAHNVDCTSCHFDVVQGQAAVTTRDCANCHDQQKYLVDFDRRDTDVVAEYHRVHVAAQRARCGDCHRAIQHRLIDPTHVGTTGGFLQPVLNDCRHCHPNHHHEQIELLLGTGSAGVLAALPNAMVASRLNCTACHTKPASDIKGDELIKASQGTCIACHGADYERLFQQWMDEISTYLRAAEAMLARVSNRIDELRAEGREVPDSVVQRIAEARQNVQLIRAGNGIHNKNYALELLDLSVQGLDQAMTTLMGP